MANKDENPFRPVPDNPSEDINILPSEGHGELHSADTGEVLEMVLGDEDEDLVFGEDDVLFGRMPQGGAGDVSEFDYLPPLEADIPANPDDDDFAGEVFESPKEEQFPVFKRALRKFQATESRPKVVRIDTEESHDQFMCERAVAEISRRMDEIEQALKDHAADDRAMLEAHNLDFDAHRAALSKHEVLGAAEAVANLSAATNAKEAAEALPKVPLDLPPFAEGKVRCWKDGDDVVCSMRFAAADGKVRVATMSARPRADVDEVARWAMQAGVDPVTVLGALPDLADVACGKKLVKDVAGAALKAHRRLDVVGMAKDGTDDPSVTGEEAEPLFLTCVSDAGSAPLAALMHVEQRANAGDPQARTELIRIHKVAATPEGKELVPVLGAATARLARGRGKKALQAAKKQTLAQKYANMSLYL